MRAPATAEVPCPACGEPITLALGFALDEPEPGASSAPCRVIPLDITERAQEHGEVCPVLTGGGCDG
ncbi:hypothetical protein SEA_NIKLAS_6 [Mycobacterium Phage Niklas]|uniref:Uncharacterized protein n=1 Tax=Mycobacterium Phage Niklas TaxID=2517936 RepID=A0A482JG43_9CAUD|nr:hypothetical protein I5H04_gp97 [Mycobacterium Phage Niklas]ASR85890.1 hypothetical protein SEA_PEANAM_6 [Mycobacterium phage Peanam]QAY02737.1 hypothetical protein SEA_SHAOBING_6 [Mycobacterium phage Shaobing]QBP31588.1 hypothetical protein SEA_NIKLAS_6 [Mycobacterium Phage Niklas]